MLKALRQLAAWGSVEGRAEPERKEPQAPEEHALLALERSGYRRRAFSENRSVLDLSLEARDVTRIRVEVLTYFKLGGGLAEVEID